MPAWCSFARVKVRQLYTLTKSNPQNASVVLIRAIQSVTEHFDEVECSERQRGAHPRFQSATVIRFDEVECSERQRGARILEAAGGSGWPAGGRLPERIHFPLDSRLARTVVGWVI